MLNERQKHILLADKSEFRWHTVNEYKKKHDLPDDSEDEKRILKSDPVLKHKGRKYNPILCVTAIPITFSKGNL